MNSCMSRTLLRTTRRTLASSVLATGALTAVLTPLSANPARAESVHDSVAVTLPPLEVTALRHRETVSRIPAGVFVLGRDSLRDQGVERVTTALATLPGFHGYGETGSGEPSVIDPRGFTASGESSYLKLLVDGQDASDVENGNVDWDWLPTMAIQRVEVIQGSGSWLYGDGSEGGIVNLVSAAPERGLHPLGSARFGSFGARSGALVGSGGSDALQGAFRFGARGADGWRERSEESAVTGGANLVWKPAERWSAGTDAAWLDRRRDEPGALTADELRADRTQAETLTDYSHLRRLALGAHAAFARTADEQWRLSPYVRIEKADGIETIFFTPQSHPTDARTAGASLNYVRNAFGGRGAFDAGAQWEESRLEGRYETTAGDLETKSEGHRRSTAVYGSARMDLGDGYLLRVGARGDAIRVGPSTATGAPSAGARTQSQASPFAALSRALGSSGMVYASAGTGFRTPTLHQLFDARPFYDPVSNQVIFISNSSLEPQRSTTFEVGGRWTHGAGSAASLALYSTRVRDEIDFDLSRFSYANLGQSWHRGVELALTQRMTRIATLIVTGSYAPTTVRGGANDGNQINGVPLGTAYGAVSVAPLAAARFSAGVRYTGRQWLDEANQHALPDFASVEFTVEGSVARLRATLRVDNLLDQDHVETGYLGALGEERFVPAAGRRAAVMLSYE